jgi:hypothetical protein
MVRDAEVGDKVMLCENRGFNGRTEAGQTMEAHIGVGMIVMLTVGDNDEVKEKTMNPLPHQPDGRTHLSRMRTYLILLTSKLCQMGPPAGLC